MRELDASTIPQSATVRARSAVPSPQLPMRIPRRASVDVLITAENGAQRHFRLRPLSPAALMREPASTLRLPPPALSEPAALPASDAAEWMTTWVNVPATANEPVRCPPPTAVVAMSGAGPLVEVRLLNERDADPRFSPGALVPSGMLERVIEHPERVGIMHLLSLCADHPDVLAHVDEGRLRTMLEQLAHASVRLKWADAAGVVHTHRALRGDFYEVSGATAMVAILYASAEHQQLGRALAAASRHVWHEVQRLGLPAVDCTTLQNVLHVVSMAIIDTTSPMRGAEGHLARAGARAVKSYLTNLDSHTPEAIQIALRSVLSVISYDDAAVAGVLSGMVVAGALSYASGSGANQLTRVRGLKMGIALLLASTTGASLVAVKVVGALLNQVSTFVMDEIGSRRDNNIRSAVCRFMAENISIPMYKFGSVALLGPESLAEAAYTPQESRDFLTWMQLVLQANGFAL